MKTPTTFATLLVSAGLAVTALGAIAETTPRKPAQKERSVYLCRLYAEHRIGGYCAECGLRPALPPQRIKHHRTEADLRALDNELRKRVQQLKKALQRRELPGIRGDRPRDNHYAHEYR
jgi:hypothetical protein